MEQYQIDLIKKILAAKLTKNEIIEVTKKAQEIKDKTKKQ
jgi:hypothetical protein